MELNLLIASKRKEHGLSQEQLAEAVGVARQTVSKWETGETIPDVPSLQKLAIALEFSIDAALDIPAMQVENEDDAHWEGFIIGGFVIGNALGLVLDQPLLGFACALAGLGLGFILQARKK